MKPGDEVVTSVCEKHGNQFIMRGMKDGTPVVYCGRCRSEATKP